MSYHRPRVFRSLHGCCICKAKSSSSRFTDSEKYTDTFKSCFNLTEGDREGDICNACVLLVKRFRKLPKKSQKNWSHVVDARAGPGVKSFVRKPRRPPDVTPKKKHVYRRRHKRKAAEVAPIVDDEGSPPPRLRRRRVDSPFRHTDSPLSIISDFNTKEDFDLLAGDDNSSRAWTPESRGTPSVRAMSRSPATVQMPPVTKKSRKRLILTKMAVPPVCSFFDSFLWKRESTCCGIISKGPYGEIVVDARYYTPCAQHTSSKNNLVYNSSHPVKNDILSDASVSVSSIGSSISSQLTSQVERTVLKSLTAAASCSSSSSAPLSAGSISDGSVASTVSVASSTVSGSTSFESLIESELKAFGLESENSNEDEEAIDFYCSENINDMKAAPVVVTSEDIDEGFFDKPLPLPSRQNKMRLSCESPSQLSL